jgi:hypothetical protein
VYLKNKYCAEKLHLYVWCPQGCLQVAEYDFVLDTPRFLLSDVVTAIPGLDQNNLKAWISRGVVSLGKFDREAGGSGRRFLLTLRTAYSLALTSRMVELGVSPARAFLNACQFTKLNLSETKAFEETDGRGPGTLLHKNGPTIFISYSKSDHLEYSSMTPIPTHTLETSKSESEALFENIFEGGSAALVLFCNPILNSVDEALDVRRDSPADDTRPGDF